MMCSPASTPTHWKNRLIVPAIVLIAAVAGGCSGTGASPPPPPSGGGNPPPPPPPPPPPMDGLWFGGVFDGSRYLNDTACLVIEAGDLACFVASPRDVQNDDGPMHLDQMVAALRGNLQRDEAGELAGSGRIYAMPGEVLADGTSVVAEFTITGGSVTRWTDSTVRQLEMHLSILGEELEIGGPSSSVYDVPAGESPWPADGVYADVLINGNPASLTIDEDGALFLQTESGCTGNGHMINVDPDRPAGTGGFNAFTVELTMENCQELNGVYEGLAALLQRATDFGSDTIAIAVFDDTTAIVGTAVK